MAVEIAAVVVARIADPPRKLARDDRGAVVERPAVDVERVDGEGGLARFRLQARPLGDEIRGSADAGAGAGDHARGSLGDVDRLDAVEGERCAIAGRGKPGPHAVDEDVAILPADTRHIRSAERRVRIAARCQVGERPRVLDVDGLQLLTRQHRRIARDLHHVEIEAIDRPVGPLRRHDVFRRRHAGDDDLLPLGLVLVGGRCARGGGSLGRLRQSGARNHPDQSE